MKINIPKMKNFKKYLFWFANDHTDFRISEIESIVSLCKTTIKWREKPSDKPYCIVELPSDEIANEIAERSVTLKYISELWIVTTTVEKLHEELKKYCSTVLQSDPKFLTYSYRFNVELFCNTQTYAEKIRRIESFSYLPLKGTVNLLNPDITFQYTEYYGNNPNNLPTDPYCLFFGRLIAKSKRSLIHSFSLKTRKFIGNTSMNPEMALIMANQAKIMEGDLVFDPFVGTGSLLVAAAHYGGYVFGVDIDFLMIHGKTKPTRKQTRHIAREGENVLANLKQYNLESRYIDVVVGDSSLPLWRPGFKLDAIITDPPYGIREPTEKIGTKSSRKNSRKSKFPTKIMYTFHQIMYDLLCFSALHLKIGGRLVTWIPVFREDYSEHSYVPEHVCFSLISNDEQILSKVLSRRLLTFEKIKEPVEEEINLCKASDSNFREKYFNYKYGSKTHSF